VKEFKREVEKELTRRETARGRLSTQTLQDPDPGHRAAIETGFDAGPGQVPRLRPEIWPASWQERARTMRTQQCSCNPRPGSSNSCLRNNGRSSCTKSRRRLHERDLPRQLRVRLDPDRSAAPRISPSRCLWRRLYRRRRGGALRRDGWKCQWCRSRSNLEVHHIEFQS
jgi:hypothetical protein